MFDEDDDDLIEGHFEVVHEPEGTPGAAQPEQEPPALPSEEKIFAYVHNKRVELVGHLTKKGMPQDRGDQMVMLAALKDMDGSALARKRVAIESGATDVAKANAALVANLLGHIKHNARSTDPIPAAVGYTPPRLGDDVPEPELLEGETATSLPQQSYATFMAKQSPQQDARSDDGSK